MSKFSAFANLSRVRTLEGKLIPAIIHNSAYFFVNLEVYEDGVVDCWELTDLELFKHKLKIGWVKTAIPDGNSISIYGLGMWKIKRGKWLFTQESFYNYILSLVKELNPSMVNLYKHFEKTINGVRIGESARGDVYKEVRKYPHGLFPERIKGDRFSIFYKKIDKYYLASLIVFPDGQLQLKSIPDEIILSYAQLETAVEEGVIQSQLPVVRCTPILGQLFVRNKMDELLTMFALFRHRPESKPEPV